MFKIIRIMGEKGKSLKSLTEELPEFYVAKRVMEIDASPVAVSKELLSNSFKTDEGGAVTLSNEKGTARVKSDSLGKSLKIITEAVSVELAEELCEEIERLITLDIDL
jgi:hypothetical protein